jgi:hypothetical protein
MPKRNPSKSKVTVTTWQKYTEQVKKQITKTLKLPSIITIYIWAGVAAPALVV